MYFQIARTRALLLFVALVGGCGTTPLDTVIAEDSGAPDAESVADAGVCFTPIPGRFTLKSALNGLCLGVGDPTTVFGNPAFTTSFAADCSLPAQAWDLSAAGGAADFYFKNVTAAFNLDVRMAAVQSGTPVIIYAANGLDNQKFEVHARGAASFELRPQNVTTSCVSAVGPTAQITPCVSSDVAQAWQIERSDCL